MTLPNHQSDVPPDDVPPPTTPDAWSQRLADRAEHEAGETGSTQEPLPDVVLSPMTPLPSENQPLSPGRASKQMLLEMAAFLERHPSFSVALRDRLSPSKQWSGSTLEKWAGLAPSVAGWRKHVRRLFYVLIVMALLVISKQMHDLQELEGLRQREEDEQHLLESQLAVRTAVVGNFALMALNIVLAVRGVQIWHLLQRVGFEGWIQTIASQLPWTRRVARVVNVATLPVRQALRPLRAPFTMRKAARDAAAAAATASSRGEGPVTFTMRKGLGAVSFIERKTYDTWKGTFSFVERNAKAAIGIR